MPAHINGVGSRTLEREPYTLNLINETKATLDGMAAAKFKAKPECSQQAAEKSRSHKG